MDLIRGIVIIIAIGFALIVPGFLFEQVVPEVVFTFGPELPCDLPGCGISFEEMSHRSLLVVVWSVVLWVALAVVVLFIGKITNQLRTRL